MSSFECKIYKLTIEEHPNADAIELARVGDYVSIVKKGQFKTGDFGVYIPEAAVVPDWMLEDMGLAGKLAGKDKNRVKAMKLRGILSQGLVWPAMSLGEETCVVKVEMYSENSSRFTDFKLGDDLTDTLGITKWEPVIPSSMSGDVFNAFGNTLKFDIENIKKFPDVIEDGEEVTFTEKLHGTWCCFGSHPEYDHPLITSKGLSDKGLAFKWTEENLNRNLYLRAFNNLAVKDGYNNVLDLFTAAYSYDGLEDWNDMAGGPFYILGEVFGKGVQDLTYDIPTQFRVFDIYVGQPGEGHYLDEEEVRTTVKKMSELGECDISYVPLLYIGPFSKEVLDDCTNGKETVSGNSVHMREGIVVRLQKERRHEEIGRVILKSVSEAYLLRKGNATEYT